VLPFGSASLSRCSRRHLRQSPNRVGKGSTHIDTAFMGLTSSGGGTVDCKLQARASPRPILFSYVITTPNGPAVVPKACAMR
jgi:hypothetical protein